MVPVWFRDGPYPEDETPKCSFLTTSSSGFLAQMSVPFWHTFPPRFRFQTAIAVLKAAARSRLGLHVSSCRGSDAIANDSSASHLPA